MQFKDIPGQEKVKERLIKTVNENRVSHAQLFLGPEGSGKLALAIAYAQYINCSNRSETDSCGVCRSCVKYNKIAHPDLHFVFPKATRKKKTIDDNTEPEDGKEQKEKKATFKDYTNEWREMVLENDSFFNLNQWYLKLDMENKQGIISAEDCNEIIKTLAYKSYESEYKVMIIWMVEKLYYSAAPKILKILEEPPEKTLFILISENQEHIINTIRSRTQLVKIPGLKDQDVRDILASKFEMVEDKAWSLALISEGNLVEALRRVNQSVTEQENLDKFRNWMRACFQFKIKEINDFVSAISKIGREKQKSFLEYVLRVARNSMIYNYKTDNIVKADEEEKEFLTKFHPFINPKNSADFYKLFNDAYYHIERNANPSVLFMDVSLKAVKLMRVK